MGELEPRDINLRLDESQIILWQSLAILVVEAAGIEPACDFDGTNEAVYDCVNCEQCRAAPALPSGRPDWLDLPSLDSDLQSVVHAREKISEPIRKAIVGLASSQE